MTSAPASSPSPPPPPKTSDDNKQDVQEAFPFRLYDMLEDSELKGFQHIISWLPNGNAFKIHRFDLFAKQILPMYFNHQTRYKSFQRQLNMYEFKTLRGFGAQTGNKPKVDQRGGFYHPMFIRGNRDCCRLVPRKTSGVHYTTLLHRRALGGRTQQEEQQDAYSQLPPPASVVLPPSPSSEGNQSTLALLGTTNANRNFIGNTSTNLPFPSPPFDQNNFLQYSSYQQLSGAGAAFAASSSSSASSNPLLSNSALKVPSSKRLLAGATDLVSIPSKASSKNFMKLRPDAGLMTKNDVVENAKLPSSSQYVPTERIWATTKSSIYQDERYNDYKKDTNDIATPSLLQNQFPSLLTKANNNDDRDFATRASTTPTDATTTTITTSRHQGQQHQQQKEIHQIGDSTQQIFDSQLLHKQAQSAQNLQYMQPIHFQGSATTIFQENSTSTTARPRWYQEHETSLSQFTKEAALYFSEDKEKLKQDSQISSFSQTDDHGGGQHSRNFKQNSSPQNPGMNILLPSTSSPDQEDVDDEIISTFRGK